MAKRLKTGGRKKGTPNKNTADIKAFAGKYTREAIKAIHELAVNAETEQIRFAAWRELLDRGCGRPAQYTEVGGPGGAPLTLVVETGVPTRTMIDITPITPTDESEPGGDVVLTSDDDTTTTVNDNNDIVSNR